MNLIGGERRRGRGEEERMGEDGSWGVWRCEVGWEKRGLGFACAWCGCGKKKRGKEKEEGEKKKVVEAGFP